MRDTIDASFNDDTQQAAQGLLDAVKGNVDQAVSIIMQIARRPVSDAQIAIEPSLLGSTGD